MPLVAYYDTVTLDASTKRRAADGTLIVRGRFARTGVQIYDNGDGTSRAEYRSDAEVRKSASSFEGVTVTDLHPEGGVVTPERWRDLARGHLQSPAFIDGWLEGDFYISDAALATAVEDGDRRELSAGYFAVPVEDVGEDPGGEAYTIRQTEITGNHVAALPPGTARAGRGAKLLFDSIQNLPRASAPRGEERRSMDDIEITIGEITYQVKADSTAAQALRLELARIPALEVERDQQQARADAAVKTEAETKVLLDAAIDPVKIDELVTARADLVAKAHKIAPKAELAGLDSGAIRAAALEASGRSVEGRSDAYVEAAFDIAVDAATPADGPTVGGIIRDMSGGASVPDRVDPMQALWASRDRHLAAQSGGEEA